MLMKLGHRDITETNPDGIDHGANAVPHASDKHSIKGCKKGMEKSLRDKSGCNFFFFLWLLKSHVTLIKRLLFPRSFIFSWVCDVTERCVKLTGGLLCCRWDNRGKPTTSCAGTAAAFPAT